MKQKAASATRPSSSTSSPSAKTANAQSPTVLVTTFGHYARGKTIGEGGTGRVFEVTDEAGEKFAAKLLDPIKSVGEKRKRFKNEILFGMKNEHKNIIRIVDHGIYNDRGEAPFYVMRLYGGTLRTLIKAGIPTDKVLIYFAQLLDGVEAAHYQGVVHRDLKPENVLHDTSSDTLAVADFGIAQFNQEELYTLIETRPTDRLANFQYAAPEQRERGQVVDQRADIFALGLMLNEMFTGAIPLGSNHKTIASVAPELSYLDELVEQMRRQVPADRPASVEIIKQQLIARKNEFISQQKISALTNTIVPVGEIDDPLVVDPVRLVAADYDRHRGVVLVLSRPINDNWVKALRSFGSHTAVWGKGPETFLVNGNTASVSASEGQVQPIIDHFKQWLPLINRKYKEIVVYERNQQEARARQQLQAQLAEEERIQRIRKSIRV